MQSAEQKRLYESILSTSQSAESLSSCLNKVLRLAISDPCPIASSLMSSPADCPSPFHFLVYSIDWFSSPYVGHLTVLEKVLRFYRGKGKYFEKIGYHFLAQTFLQANPCCTPNDPTLNINLKACQCFVNLISKGYDRKLVIQCLKENYPHKLANLDIQLIYMQSLLWIRQRASQLRLDILEIVIVELASLDTQLSTTTSQSPQSLPTRPPKLDILLTTLLTTLLTPTLTTNTTTSTTYKQLLLIFNSSLIHIDMTKNMQLIVYYFAELSVQNSMDFVFFLLAEIFDAGELEEKGSRKIREGFCSYLASYLCVSRMIPPIQITKTLSKLIKYTNKLLDKKTQQHLPHHHHHYHAHVRMKQASVLQNLNQMESEVVNLGDTFEEYFDVLLMLQTVLWIWGSADHCRDTNTQSLTKLTTRCQHNTHFQYFLCPQILTNIQLPSPTPFPPTSPTTKRTIASSPKFQQTQLKQFGFLVNHLIKNESAKIKNSLKLEQILSEEVKQEGLPYKRVKSEKKDSLETQV